jgi:hypothetical protein
MSEKTEVSGSARNLGDKVIEAVKDGAIHRPFLIGGYGAGRHDSRGGTAIQCKSPSQYLIE